MTQRSEPMPKTPLPGISAGCDCGVCGFEHDAHNAPTQCGCCGAWCYGVADDYEETDTEIAAKGIAS